MARWATHRTGVKFRLRMIGRLPWHLFWGVRKALGQWWNCYTLAARMDQRWRR